jgi:hypothetical protein
MTRQQTALTPAIAAPRRANEAQAANVPYPGRKLGYSRARSDEDAAYDDRAWAAIAAANMRPGDTFELCRRKVRIESVTEKTLKLRTENEKATSLTPVGTRWESFIRDLGAQIVCENLRAHSILKPALARPLIEILQRDPAVHVDGRGSVYLRDCTPS